MQTTSHDVLPRMVHRFTQCAAWCLASLVSLAAQETGQSIRLRVLDCKGGLIQYASVNLLRVSNGQAAEYGQAATYGKVPEFSERTLEPRDFIGDFAEIHVGLQGHFVLRVGSELHAHTHSLPFDLPSEGTHEITVRMLRGGVLEGVVVDTDGRPIAGAEVSTSQFEPPCGRFCIHCMHGRLPELATKTKVRTNSDGKYRLERLCFGDYRLSVMHDEYCDEKRVQQIVDERAITLPPITMQRGCTVEGVVTLDGVPTAGARVCVCANLDVLPENAVLPDALNTFTDADGRYSFARRVPAGSWKIWAAAAEQPGKESNPFAVLIQLKESQRALQLQVGAGKNVNLALKTPDSPSR